jgi:hypothetical protein
MIIVYKRDGSFNCEKCVRVFMSFQFRVERDAEFHNNDEHDCKLQIVTLEL